MKPISTSFTAVNKHYNTHAAAPTLSKSFGQISDFMLHSLISGEYDTCMDASNMFM